MSLNLFSHWIGLLPIPRQRGPPSVWGVKAGIAKCHFAKKQRESRAFTDISWGIPPVIECR